MSATQLETALAAVSPNAREECLAVLSPPTAKDQNQLIVEADQQLTKIFNAKAQVEHGDLFFNIELAKMKDVWTHHPRSVDYNDFPEFCIGVVKHRENIKKRIALGRVLRYLVQLFPVHKVALINKSEAVYQAARQAMHELKDMSTYEGKCQRVPLWVLTFQRTMEIYEEAVRAHEPDMSDDDMYSAATRTRYFRGEMIKTAACEVCPEQVCVCLCVPVCVCVCVSVCVCARTMSITNTWLVCRSSAWPRTNR